MRSAPCKPARWPILLLRLALLLVPLAGCAEGKLGVVAEATLPQPAIADAHGAGMELASFQIGQSASTTTFPALFATAAKSHGIDLTDVNTDAADSGTSPGNQLLAKGYISVSDDAMATSVVDIYDANHQILIHIEDQQNTTSALDQGSLKALADKTANDVAAFLAQHLNDAAPPKLSPAAPETPPVTTAATKPLGLPQEMALAKAQ